MDEFLCSPGFILPGTGAEKSTQILYLVPDGHFIVHNLYIIRFLTKNVYKNTEIGDIIKCNMYFYRFLEKC